MAKIRVLVVDDSSLIRRLQSEAISASDDFEVAGTAPNGLIALAKIGQLQPDIVSLDLVMPVMDGMQTIRAIREEYPNLPIVLFSSGITYDTNNARDAIMLGANDVLAKPRTAQHDGDAKSYVQNELLPKLRKVFNEHTPLPGSAAAGKPATAIAVPRTPIEAGPKPRASQRIDIVAIGVSTGGPQALSCLLSEIPPNFDAPIVIVQHMPAMFTKLLADRLSKICPLNVREASAGVILQPGEVWIAPGDYHLTVTNLGSAIGLETNQGPPENSCRPAADVLFRFVAQVYGPNALACILTGMGQDGMLGARAIREAGGYVIAQDEATSVVWGMPRAIVHAGLADSILPLDRIADELSSRVKLQRHRSPLQVAK